MSHSSPSYCFGRCSLHLATRELRVDANLIAVEPRVFNLLVYLIERRDRIVTKDELLDQLWANAPVSDSALAQAIMKTRKAIEDEGGAGSVIRTVNRIGYRFIAPIEVRLSNPTEANDPTEQAESQIEEVALANTASAINYDLRLFATIKDLERWESALAILRGFERLEPLLQLAWHLRQTDVRRAQRFAAEAETIAMALPISQALQVTSRISLVHSETQALLGEWDVAREFAMKGKVGFESQNDAVGRTDAHLLLMQLAEDGGDIEDALFLSEQAIDSAMACGDQERLAVARTSRVTHLRHLARKQSISARPTDPICVSGITFESELVMQEQKLFLNGAGVRCRFEINLYAAGLYSARRLTTPEAVFEARGAKCLRVVMLRRTEAHEVSKLFTLGLEKNASREEFARAIPGTLRLGEILAAKKHLDAGEQYAIEYTPDSGTNILINGQPFVEPIMEPAFFTALMKIWFGKEPVDDRLRDDLLGL